MHTRTRQTEPLYKERQRPGTSVQVRRGRERLEGVSEGVDPNGFLLLRQPDGSLTAVDGEILAPQPEGARIP